MTCSRSFCLSTGTIDTLFSKQATRHSRTYLQPYHGFNSYRLSYLRNKLISHTKTKAELTAFWPMRLWREKSYREACHYGVGDKVQSKTQGHELFVEQPGRSGHEDYSPCARRYSPGLQLTVLWNLRSILQTLMF